MLAAGICVFFLSRPLVNLVGGKGFEEAIPLFKYFLPAIVFYSMPMVLSTQWNILGIFRHMNTVSMAVFVLSLTGNILLVPYIGITGGAISFLLVSFLSFCIHIWFVQKYMGKTPLKDIILIKQADINALLKKS